MSDTDKLADALDELCDAVRVYDRCPDKYNHNAMTEARAAVASLAAPPAQGEWVMVPRVPTQAMIEAAAVKLWHGVMQQGKDVGGVGADVYKAMLAAAPQPAPAPVEVDETVSRP